MIEIFMMSGWDFYYGKWIFHLFSLVWPWSPFTGKSVMILSYCKRNYLQKSFKILKYRVLEKRQKISMSSFINRKLNNFASQLISSLWWTLGAHKQLIWARLSVVACSFCLSFSMSALWNKWVRYHLLCYFIIISILLYINIYFFMWICFY